MTRIVLEIPQEKDRDLLLDLLHRLGVRIVEESQVMDEDTAAYILSGLPARDDFDDFAQDFEAACKDRDMPDRIN